MEPQPPPRPPSNTLVGAEFGRLFDAASSIVAPLFLSKVNRVVYYMLSWMEDKHRLLLIYGLIIPPAIHTALHHGQGAHHEHKSSIFPSLADSRAILLIDGVVTSVLTGKTIHSMGIGVMLIPLFITIQYII